MARSNASYRSAAKHASRGTPAWPMYPITKFAEDALARVQETDTLLVNMLWSLEARRQKDLAEKEAERIREHNMKIEAQRVRRRKRRVEKIARKEEVALKAVVEESNAEAELLEEVFA